MPKQTRPDDQKDMANDASNKEPAEGSRENVNTSSGAGITNRSIDEERQEQQSLPPRGQNKEGGHA